MQRAGMKDGLKAGLLAECLETNWAVETVLSMAEHSDDLKVVYLAAGLVVTWEQHLAAMKAVWKVALLELVSAVMRDEKMAAPKVLSTAERKDDYSVGYLVEAKAAQ